MAGIIKSTKIASCFLLFFVFCNSKCISSDLSEGGTIYFMRNKTIMRMNADGSEKTPIYYHSYLNNDFSISPDGLKIVFVLDYPGLGAPSDLFIMNSDGSSVKQLTFDRSVRHPTFSRNGKKIIYADDDGNDLEIYIMDVNGSNIKRITNNSTHDVYPSISADGSKILFVRNSSIYIMNIDGTGQKRLTTGHNDNYVSLSPDGSRIIFTRDNKEIYIMNSDGTGQTNLTTSVVTENMPAFSPDGNKIVFCRHDSNWDIYLMNADGSNQQRLTTDALADTRPCFSGKPR